jgi:hypothetical protein
LDKKSRSLNPVPGGSEGYLFFIVQALTKIHSNELSRNEFAEWIRLDFGMTGKLAIKSYIRVLVGLGLVNDFQQLRISEKGEEFLKTRNSKIILGSLLENYAGVQEILILLNKKPGSNNKEIRAYIEETCDLKWGSDTQISRRLTWLKALGIIRGIRRGYVRPVRYFLSSEKEIAR